jgi:hypothetical protein
MTSTAGYRYFHSVRESGKTRYSVPSFKGSSIIGFSLGGGTSSGSSASSAGLGSVFGSEL